MSIDTASSQTGHLYLVGVGPGDPELMTYKAVRTDRYKLIHWVNRGRHGELDELYDLEKDPYELKNLIRSRAHATIKAKLHRELKKLVAEAVGL